MKILKIVYHILFFAIFVMSIAVQYNDPDPYLWMLLYFLPILLGALHLFRIPVRWPALLLALGYTVYAVWIYPGLIPDPINNEEFREAGGLLICVAYLLGLVVTGGSPARKTAS